MAAVAAALTLAAWQMFKILQLLQLRINGFFTFTTIGRLLKSHQATVASQQSNAKPIARSGDGYNC